VPSAHFPHLGIASARGLTKGMAAPLSNARSAKTFHFFFRTCFMQILPFGQEVKLENLR
jgi:hypothetical protein